MKCRGSTASPSNAPNTVLPSSSQIPILVLPCSSLFFQQADFSSGALSCETPSKNLQNNSPQLIGRVWKLRLPHLSHASHVAEVSAICVWPAVQITPATFSNEILSHRGRVAAPTFFTGDYNETNAAPSVAYESCRSIRNFCQFGGSVSMRCRADVPGRWR